MKKKSLGFVLILFLGFVSMIGIGMSQQMQNSMPDKSESTVQAGYHIAPVPLDLKGKNLALVKLGSYHVNAVGGCNDCHTCPSYNPNNNPYIAGPPGEVNVENYLAGGVPFGPFISRNITPDTNGMPAGLTSEEFMHVILTGQDPDDPGLLLQVMPWPIYRNMTNKDLMGIYEYLSAIPHANPGTCSGAGE